MLLGPPRPHIPSDMGPLGLISLAIWAPVPSLISLGIQDPRSDMHPPSFQSDEVPARSYSSCYLIFRYVQLRNRPSHITGGPISLLQRLYGCVELRSTNARLRKIYITLPLTLNGTSQCRLLMSIRKDSAIQTVLIADRPLTWLIIWQRQLRNSCHDRAACLTFRNH